MLRLFVFASIFAFAFSLCPNTFDLVRNGECYKQIGDARNIYSPNGPSTVESECGQYGAMPVMIKNKEDNDYWMGVAKHDHDSNGANYGFVLLGISCDQDGYWRWTDGTSIDWRPDNYDHDLIEYCDKFGGMCMWTLNPVTQNWQKYCGLYKTVDMYCIIAPVVNPVEPDPDCGSFSDDDDDDICYQVGATATNWTEANNVCHSFGANVASIHNDRENNFIRRLAVSKGLVNGMMLGATWKSKKNSFKWADGTKWDYDNFAKGFPLDGFGDCLAMDTNNAAGQWMNVDCSVELPFACVRKTGAKTPACDGGIHEEGEVIYSPGFPNSASEPCDFMLMVDPGMLVEVEILFLEANECCDHLLLFEGTLGGKQIAT